MYNFFAYISRMKYINRWALMRNTYAENIQEHSLEVSIIANALAIIRNEKFGGSVNVERVTLAGMYHDCSEIITGDMPTPVKYHNADIKESYKKIENLAKSNLISMLPDFMSKEIGGYINQDKLTDEEKNIVKVADKLSGYIKCIEEEKAGNNEFVKAKESLKEIIDNLDMAEVKYFMDNFMPAYSLTLDELDVQK